MTKQERRQRATGRVMNRIHQLAAQHGDKRAQREAAPYWEPCPLGCGRQVVVVHYHGRPEFNCKCEEESR